MENGHTESIAIKERPSPTHQRTAQSDTKTTDRSPAKSSSTSEEEGQFEEQDRVAKRPANTSTTSPARRISPREAITQDSNAMSRESSTPTNGKQSTPLHPGRPGSYSRTHDAIDTAYTASSGRARGLESIDAEAGPSRRAVYRNEDRASHHEPYPRYRDVPQTHEQYDAATRSMSIGSFDERYYSPSAAHYDDRTRDWNRERERERLRDRDYQWDRARDPAWSRPQYGRPSSPTRPSRPSPTPHTRRTSGSWSGPTSPSASWRERWSSGSGAAGNAWERDRDRDRDRDRERAGYWQQGRDAFETGPDAYRRRVSNPRSPPLREGRDPSRSRAAKANYAHLLQSNSSPTPSIGRSPNIQRTFSNGSRQEEESRYARGKAERASPIRRSESAEGPPASPLSEPQMKKEQGHIEDPGEDKSARALEKTISVQEKVRDDMESKGLTTEVAAGPSPFAQLEAITEEAPNLLLIEETAAKEDAVSGKQLVPPNLTDVNKQEQEQEQEHKVQAQGEDVASIDTADPITTHVAEEAAGIIEVSESNQKKEKAAVDGKSPQEQLGDFLAVAADVESEMHLGDTAMTEGEHLDVEDQVEAADMEADEQYDASNDITTESMDIGDDTDSAFPQLKLDERRFHDLADDPPLPTPRTREEQDRQKRESMYRLLQGYRPNALEVKKVFEDNKLLAAKSMKPLESAIHGEYPRKNHTEPWLDEDDEEVKSMRVKMIRMMQARQKKLNGKVASLKQRYKQLNKEWQQHCAQLYRQSEARESQNSRTLFGGTVTVSGTSASLISQGAGTGQGQGGGGGGTSTYGGGGPAAEDTSLSAMGLTRANRRQTQTGFAGFGDAVRSEAEFLEILASLENADMQDPNMRAARTTATEPDMVLNPDSKAALFDDYDDDNGFVADPLAFYFPTFDPDYWAEEEKATFERRYALFPKQFGKIAASLPHKTAKQCVSYYYLTKHNGHDYKSLTAARNRDRKRKTRVKPKKGRGSALMADLKGDDLEDDEQQSPGEGNTADSTSLISAKSRPAGASSRARILTSSTLSGDLGVVAEEGEDDSFDIPIGRKRRVDEMDSDEKKSRPGSKAKRAKSEKRIKGDVAGTPGEDAASSSLMNMMHGDPDMAAAEALGALAGAGGSNEVATSGDISFSRRKKTSKGVSIENSSSIRREGMEDASKRSRQTTSSYWSVAERNEFLRSLATWGKDWDVIASTLSTKSAAQARNYYARNVEETEFVEAVTLAKDNVALDLATRQAIATAFIHRKASMAIERTQQMGAPQSGYFAASATPTPDGVTPTARGLNINSLLNDEMASSTGGSRRASVNEWFGQKTKDEDSNDDTEDEELEQAGEEDEAQRRDREPSDYFDGRGRSSHYDQGYTSAALPPRHLMTSVHRRSPSILSSMPPPSAFIGTGRYQLPGQQRLSTGGQEGQRSPLSSFHYVDSMSRGSSQSPLEGHPSAPSHRLGHYERDAGRSSWSSSVSTPSEAMPPQHRQSSWPHAYSPAHLAPPQSTQASVLREDRSPSSVSPYPRPNPSQGTASLSSYPFPHPMYERPHSSGHISSVRSLSPNPPTPRLPQLNQSLFSHRRESPRDSSQ